MAVDSSVTVQGWTGGGRPVDVAALRSPGDLELVDEQARMRQEARQREVEAAQEATRVWVGRRDELQASVEAAGRVREVLAIRGPDALEPEELAAVQKAALLAAAETLLGDAKAALEAHKTPGGGGYRG